MVFSLLRVSIVVYNTFNYDQKRLVKDSLSTTQNIKNTPNHYNSATGKFENMVVYTWQCSCGKIKANLKGKPATKFNCCCRSCVAASVSFERVFCDRESQIEVRISLLFLSRHSLMTRGSVAYHVETNQEELLY